MECAIKWDWLLKKDLRSTALLNNDFSFCHKIVSRMKGIPMRVANQERRKRDES